MLNKKTYVVPQLTTYGSVQQLTQTLKNKTTGFGDFYCQKTLLQAKPIS
jgi:hypothetical protein